MKAIFNLNSIDNTIQLYRDFRGVLVNFDNDDISENDLINSSDDNEVISIPNGETSTIVDSELLRVIFEKCQDSINNYFDNYNESIDPNFLIARRYINKIESLLLHDELILTKSFELCQIATTKFKVKTSTTLIAEFFMHFSEIISMFKENIESFEELKYEYGPMGKSEVLDADTYFNKGEKFHLLFKIGFLENRYLNTITQTNKINIITKILDISVHTARDYFYLCGKDEDKRPEKKYPSKQSIEKVEEYLSKLK